MSVYIENEYDGEIPVSYNEIVEDIVAASLDYLKCPYDCEVNILFTNNDGIQELNRNFRNIDSPTDVLSFPMLEFEKVAVFDSFEEHPEDCFNQDSGELMLGDIVLNVDRIKSQAEEYGHTKRRELAFLVAHSMLHLSGYDHIDDNERQIMEQLQETILTMKGYTRDNEKE